MTSTFANATYKIHKRTGRNIYVKPRWAEHFSGEWDTQGNIWVAELKFQAYRDQCNKCWLKWVKQNERTERRRSSYIRKIKDLNKFYLRVEQFLKKTAEFVKRNKIFPDSYERIIKRGDILTFFCTTSKTCEELIHHTFMKNGPKKRNFKSLFPSMI